jgi:hypothetical protein
MSKQPNWFDNLIGDERDPQVIGRKLIESKEFQDAVRQGLIHFDNRQEGEVSAMQSQYIREQIAEALNGTRDVASG